MPEDRSRMDIVHGVPPVAITSTTTLANRTGSWKYIRPIYQDKVAPCNAGCPVGIDIEAYMNLLREGHLDAALDVLLRENPLPATTGRVCEHPCESVCNRKKFDEPVAIHAVERMLGDVALEAAPPAPPEQRRKEKVAVVGSGPAGLACAYHLARMGYAVRVYEADPEPGGMLRYAIPDYKLPKGILAREIERIRALGVEIRCSARVGKDVKWDEVAAHDAVFLAIGAHQALPLGLKDGGPGVLAGLEFLRQVNSAERPRLAKKTVVVVGADNTALDCARAAVRLGAASATLVCPVERGAVPAFHADVAEAEHEGVQLHFGTRPGAVHAPAGKPATLECSREDGSKLTLNADVLIAAAGEQPDFAPLPPDVKRADGAVRADDLGATSRTAVFAGGDLAGEPRTVAHALGAGKRAAVGIDRFLRQRAGEKVEADLAQLRYGGTGNVSATRWRGDDPVRRSGEVNEIVAFEQMNMAHFQHAPRHADRRRPAAERRSGFAEVNLGLPPPHAHAEALRCFNCGVCNQCEVCLVFCPDVAITRRAEGAAKFSISYKYCKGCGVCSFECPRGAMAMTREGL
ncbi:MAG TPA: FAD-dependent oxidoreductase [Candidatus Saccharimonadales bacterium]|nr:FAD-dependent oxidoreductase [Candidatus Saccharimonadales bacterium]